MQIKIFRFLKKRKRSVPATQPLSQPRHRYLNPFFPKETHILDQKKQQKSNDSWVYVGMVALVLAAIIYVLNYIPYIKVTKITIDGNNYISRNEIEKIVKDVLSDKYFYFIQKNSYLLFNTYTAQTAIEKNISDHFALKEVSVTKKFPRAVHVSITERIPRLVWITNNEYSYIDPTGFITQRTNPDELNAEFPKIFDHNNLPVEMNTQSISESLVTLALALYEQLPQKTSVAIDTFYIPPIVCHTKEIIKKEVPLDQLEEDEVAFIDDQRKIIQEQLQNGDITVEESLDLLAALDENRQYTDDNNQSLANESVTSDSNINSDSLSNINSLSQPKSQVVFEEIYTPTTCNLAVAAHDIHVKTTGGWDIYFTDQSELSAQINKLNAILQEKFPEEPRDIQYIDVRLGDKVYYK